MKRPKIALGEIYHIYNRGVEKRKVFLDKFDYLRFIHNMYEFNDKNPALDMRSKANFRECREVGLPDTGDGVKERRKLVEILSFCLMDNHFHMMIREVEEGGLTAFMRKIGTGYTNYFNLKYKRVGSLFQGKFKAVHLNSDQHFLYLPFYIHLNPLDFQHPEWRLGQVEDAKGALDFLETYRWSSLLDYLEKRNFPSIISKEFLLPILDKPENQRRKLF